MNLPLEYLAKLEKEFDLTPVLSLIDTTLIDQNIHDLIVAENYETLLKILKIKLILIHKNKSNCFNYDLVPVLNKMVNCQLSLAHGILLHLLLIQNNTTQANELFINCCNYLNNETDENLMLYLELLDVILEIGRLNMNFVVNDLSNLITNLLNLILSCEKDVQKKVVEDILPKIVQCTKSNQILLDIWTRLQNDSSTNEYVLNVLEDYFIPLIWTSDKFTILDQDEFWLKLQRNIISKKADLKKKWVYMLERAIKSMLDDEVYFKYIASKVTALSWERTNVDKYKDAWKNFFILWKASNEKQLHLIKPALKLYQTLKCLDNSWKVCVTHVFITHSHAAIVQSAVLNVLSLNWLCSLETLIRGLNNYFLYDRSSESIETHLNKYVAGLNLKDFETFVHYICAEPPSPVPFYYICNAIKTYKMPECNLQLIIDLLNVSKSIPHLHIRKGVQHAIVFFLTNLKLDGDSFKSDTKCNQLTSIIFTLNDMKYFAESNMLGITALMKWISPMKKMLFDFTFHKSTVRSIAYFGLLYKNDRISCEWVRIYLNESYLSIKTTQDARTKLDLLCSVCNFLKILQPYGLPFTQLLLSNSLDGFCNEITIICKEFENQYNVEICDTIEQIVDILFSNHNCDYNMSQTLINKASELLDPQQCNTYLIIVKKIVQIWDQILIKHENHVLPECKTSFISFLTNLKAVKRQYKEQMNTDVNTNRKLLRNYYYAKLNLLKLLHASDDVLKILTKASKYFDRGSPDILDLVLDIFFIVIRYKDLKSEEVQLFCTLLSRCRTEIFQIRNSERFHTSIKKFIRVLSLKSMFEDEALTCYNYANEFFNEMFGAKQTVVGIRNYILENVSVSDLKSNIIAEALVYGPVLRKDQRIEYDTCALIESDKLIKGLNPDLISPYELDKQVRSKAINILLLLNNPEIEYKYEEITKLLQEKYDDFTNKRYFPNSQIHLLKQRILQALHVIGTYSKKFFDIHEIWIIDCLLMKNQQPSVKLLAQWLLVRVYEDYTPKGEIVLDFLDEMEFKKIEPVHYTTIFPVLYYLMKEKNLMFATLERCLFFLIMCSAGQTFSVRLAAQIAIKHIYKINRSNERFRHKYKITYDTILNTIGATNSPKTAEAMLPYEVIQSISFKTLFYHIPRLTNVTHTEWLDENCFSDEFSIPKQYKADVLDQNKPINSNKSDEDSNDDCEFEFAILQKKIEPIRKVIPNLNLIVVASLIDQATNLGGLSRTCEVFAVKRLVVNNAQVVKSKEYQGLSMSSEKLVEPLQVKVEELSNYLIELKKLGYRIVGAEQTTNSKNLNQYEFQKSTVLLLGNEKEGIRPNLIHLLDDCIQIPQFGQIRSLNVHVAGALCIWEYTKQHFAN